MPRGERERVRGGGCREDEGGKRRSKGWSKRWSREMAAAEYQYGEQSFFLSIQLISSHLKRVALGRKILKHSVDRSARL